MKRGEKGFTLLEILVGVAIMGVIAMPLAMLATTLLTNPERSNDKNIVLQQVRNAGTWISRDVQMSRSANTTDPNGFPLTLQIPVDNDENNDYSIEYLLDSSKLKRRVYDASENLTSETLIADYIASDNTTFASVNATAGLHKLTVRAVKDGTGVTGGYEISQRLISGQ